MPEAVPRPGKPRRAAPLTIQGGEAFDPVEALDLRRRARRETVERLARLAEHLPPEDRELVRAVFVDGRRMTELARLAREPVRRVRTRVRKLVRRLLDPRFEFVAGARSRWARTRRRVAVMGVIEGKPMRTIASELGLSLHQVRRHDAAISALFEATRDARAAARSAGIEIVGGVA